MTRAAADRLRKAFFIVQSLIRRRLTSEPAILAVCLIAGGGAVNRTPQTVLDFLHRKLERHVVERKLEVKRDLSESDVRRRTPHGNDAPVVAYVGHFEGSKRHERRHYGRK